MIQLQDGSSIVPAHANLYHFFQPRTRKITVVSIGVDEFGLESYITEQTGCTVYSFDHRSNSKEKYDLLQSVLQKKNETKEVPEWIQNLEKRWIEPSKLLFSQILPLGFNGTVDGVETSSIPFQKIDILCVNIPQFETKVVYSILDSGFRPGIVHIRWDKHPDENSSSMLCAGHLQMCGYTLMGYVENSFLYMFNDQCVYETTSWASTDSINPALEGYRRQLFEQYMSCGIKEEKPVEKETKV